MVDEKCVIHPTWLRTPGAHLLLGGLFTEFAQALLGMALVSPAAIFPGSPDKPQRNPGKFCACTTAPRIAPKAYTGYEIVLSRRTLAPLL